MNKINLTFLFLVISILLVILFFLCVKLILSIKRENRIKNFAMENNYEEDSIADSIYYYLNSLVKRLSMFIKKSNIINDYGKHLSKYLIYSKSKYNEIDYISIKILLMLFIDILYFISIMIKYMTFDANLFIIISALSFFTIDIYLFIKYKSYQKLIEDELLQAVVIMNSAFKSGKNIYKAIDIVRNEVENPIKKEFDIIATDINYGLDIETAFKRFSNRVNVKQAEYITASLSLLSKTGGSIVTVFNMIEKNFYDKLKLKNELSSLTSSSKFLYRFLIIIPLIFVLGIILMDYDYFTPLFTSTIGLIILAIIILLYILYIICIKKIIKVEEI